MRMQEFFEHYGLAANPFADEDAQSDPIFKKLLSTAVFHPAWDKIYGRPDDVSTAIVFGEKGSGKTALRLQIQEHLEQYNREHAHKRVFIIPYDDFNPFLDRFHEAKGGTGRATLKLWSLWDHMDAILSRGVTAVVNRLIGTGKLAGDDSMAIELKRVARLPPLLKRDLLLLATFYDSSRQAPFVERWKRLARRLGYWTTFARWQEALGWLGSFLGLLIVGRWLWTEPGLLAKLWPWIIVGALVLGMWVPAIRKRLKFSALARKIARDVAVVPRQAPELRTVLERFKSDHLEGQPFPVAGPADVRYQLLSKLQAILKELGFAGIVVLMDRVDEPQLLSGSPEAMRDFVWSLLDNKLLRMPGVGFKLLLPIELSYFLPKESREFYERSRLDKQNTIRSLEWSGQALYDMASERLSAGLAPRGGGGSSEGQGARLALRDVLEEGMSAQEVVSSLERLRVPRHLFKFLYRLMTEHCNAYTSDAPVWKIGPVTYHSVLKVYLRDLEAFDHGYGHG